MPDRVAPTPTARPPVAPLRKPIRGGTEEARASAVRTVLVISGIGMGKTLNIRTLPGRKFVYFFDPNGAEVVREDPTIDYLEFCPDREEIDIAVHSLSKGLIDKTAKDRTATKVPETYRTFARDFNQRGEIGFFKDYDWLVFDSCTTLSELIMDRITGLNSRLGQPHEDDYGPEMAAMKSLFRIATNLGCHIYCTAHQEGRQDRITKEVSTQVMFTGRNRVRIPLMFSQIYVLGGGIKGDKAEFYAQTVPDHNHPIARTNVAGLKVKENITIDLTKPLLNQGLGRFVNGPTARTK